MISILVNPDCPELIFSTAALWVQFEEEYPEEIIDIIPICPTDFKKTMPEIYDELTAEIEKYEKEFLSESMRYGLSDMQTDIYPDKIALLGIYPSNKEEADDLIQFLERESDNILLWLDNHKWPAGLVSFFQSQNSNIFVEENEYLLKLTDVYFPPDLVAAEQALTNRRRANSTARRYWRAYQQVKLSYDSFEKIGLFSFFHMAVDEIIFFEENTLLTLLAKEHSETIARTMEALKRFSMYHPAFSDAKECRRPVGFISVRNLGLIDMEKIIQEGLKRFPWLIVIETGTDEEPFLRLESLKMPIEDILVNYTDVLQGRINPDKVLAAANKIVVGYKEHIAV